MDFETVNCRLSVDQIPGIFRQSVEQRPLRSKMNRVNIYTPDIGPYLGIGGIVDPVYSIAVDVAPVNSANTSSGGTIVMLVEQNGDASHVVVITDRWSRLSFSTSLRAIRDGLLERLRSASPIPSNPQGPRPSPPLHVPSATTVATSESPPARDKSDLSTDALLVAEVLSASSGSTFEDISKETGLPLVRVSDSIKELEMVRTLIRGRGGVYRFVAGWTPPAEAADQGHQQQQQAVETTVPAAVAPATLSAAERIEKLEAAASLLEKDLISQDEFDELRADLRALRAPGT